MKQDFLLHTTVRLESGLCTFLPLHLDRLASAAKAFNFAFDREGLEKALITAAAQHRVQSPLKLRLTVDRSGVWTFASPEHIDPDSTLLQAMLWPDPIDSSDRFLRYRTTHRPVYDRALRKAKELGFVDAIFHNERGLVTEGSDHSVFVRHRDSWTTPTISAGVLPGVYRSYLLETLPAVREVDFQISHLLSADEIWLTNAVQYARAVTIAPQSSSKLYLPSERSFAPICSSAREPQPTPVPLTPFI